MTNYIKKCPECGGINLIIHKDKGEVICKDCGLVIEEKMIDLGQEWREFDHEQSAKRRRTGAPMSYSVDYDEPVIIKKDNIIKIVKIGKFVDDLLAENSSFIKKQDNLEYASISDYECVVFDKDYKIQFKKISEVSRHKVSEMFNITLETGKSVKVTGQHSLFTVSNNEIIPIKVSEIKKEDFIVAPKQIPSIQEIREINLLDEFIILSRNNPDLYLRGFNDGELFHKLKELSKQHKILKDKVKNWIRHKTLPLWVLNYFSRDLNIYNYNLENTRVGIYSGPNELPIKLNLDKGFARLLGYYISEGTTRPNSIVFSFGTHEIDYINDVKEIVKNIFGIEVYERINDSATQLEIKSKLVALFFKEILKTGENAHNKRIPYIVYSMPNELKLEFLNSYINGDGSKVITYIANNRPQVCISTSSVNKELTNDIILLESQLGVHANYQEAFISGHTINKTGQYIKDTVATRSLITNPDKAFELGFLKEKPSKNKGKPSIENFIPAPLEYKKEWRSRKQIRINRQLALKIANKYNNIKLKKLSESQLLFLRVTKIEKTTSTSSYAYDLTVPGYENFVGGMGGIFLHNTKYDQGLGTSIGQTSDVYKLGSKDRNKFFRLKKWQYRISTAIERNLKLALAELKRVASYLKLPKSVEEESARIYTMAVQRGLVRGRSMESVVSGALYAACRRHEIPRTLDELSEASGIDKKEIGRTYRFITRELGIRILPSNPVDYLPRFASALKLNAETQSRAVDILEQAQKAELTSGRGPTGIAAASLYVAALINNEKRTQREVADVAGVTEVTIRNRYKELLKELKLKDKIKKKIKELED